MAVSCNTDKGEFAFLFDESTIKLHPDRKRKNNTETINCSFFMIVLF